MNQSRILNSEIMNIFRKRTSSLSHSMYDRSRTTSYNSELHENVTPKSYKKSVTSINLEFLSNSNTKNNDDKVSAPNTPINFKSSLPPVPLSSSSSMNRSSQNSSELYQMKSRKSTTAENIKCNSPVNIKRNLSVTIPNENISYDDYSPSHLIITLPQSNNLQASPRKSVKSNELLVKSFRKMTTPVSNNLSQKNNVFFPQSSLDLDQCKTNFTKRRSSGLIKHSQVISEQMLYSQKLLDKMIITTIRLLVSNAKNRNIKDKIEIEVGVDIDDGLKYIVSCLEKYDGFLEKDVIKTLSELFGHDKLPLEMGLERTLLLFHSEIEAIIWRCSQSFLEILKNDSNVNDIVLTSDYIPSILNRINFV